MRGALVPIGMRYASCGRDAPLFRTPESGEAERIEQERDEKTDCRSPRVRPLQILAVVEPRSKNRPPKPFTFTAILDGLAAIGHEFNRSKACPSLSSFQ